MRSCQLFVFVAVWIFSACFRSDTLVMETDAIPQLTRIFPDTDDSKQQFSGCIAASPLMVSSQGEPFVFVAVSDGLLAGVQPKTGQRVWEIRLPAPEGYRPWLVATLCSFKTSLLWPIKSVRSVRMSA